MIRTSLCHAKGYAVGGEDQTGAVSNGWRQAVEGSLNPTCNRPYEPFMCVPISHVKHLDVRMSTTAKLPAGDCDISAVLLTA